MREIYAPPLATMTARQCRANETAAFFGGMPHPLTSLPLCAAVVGGFGDCMKTARNSGNYEETSDLKSAMEAVAKLGIID